ncbi:hypothetical protein K440DRAFT_668652 [Wilcoxina mikolae CBS 423.85]|nr:hypothetical protein K440DRAFT_668652 [Wilcoxina mikolae CBS 423.85]
MTFTPVNESSATAIKETALRSTITVEKAGSHTLVDQALATTTRYRKVVSPTMVAPDTADSAKSPPTKSPPAKLSTAKSRLAKLFSTEWSPTKPCPTINLIPVTCKIIDHAPATLPLQALENLCDGFFPDRHFDSIQEAVEITVKKLTLQDQSKFMHGVYELFADIHKVSNAQVAWLSEFEENNTGWRELGYKRYYDYLRTIDSSGLVREMVKQHNTVQKHKDHARKKLGDYWQQTPELLEILNEGDGSEKWLQLIALATRTAKDPEIAKRCLNYAYVSRIIKLGRKSKVNRWFTSANFNEAKALLEKGCSVVNDSEEINLRKLGLKLYRGLVMPVAYYPFKEDQSRTHTLSPSAPPPNRQIPSALPILISSTPPTEEEEKLSDFEVPTPSESLSSENSSPKIPDIPDTTPDDVTEVVDDITEVVVDVTEVVDDVTEVVDDATKVIVDVIEVVDDVTEVVDEDDEAISSDNESSDNESSETAFTPSPVRTKAFRKRKKVEQLPTPNPTEDKPIDGYDAVVTCSDYIERDVRYTHLVGEEERMITYRHGIYGTHAPLIFQRAINREPDVFLTARDQIVSGMIAMRNVIIRAEKTLGEASYFINEQRKGEDERRKRARRE